MISCESTLILNGVADKFLEGKIVCHLPHENVFCLNISRLRMNYFPKGSPREKYMLKLNSGKPNYDRQQNGKWRTASLLSGSVTECVSVWSPKGHPGDESYLSTPRLTVWSWSWSQRGGQEAVRHGTLPLGAGWCPLTDWGCKGVFNGFVCASVFMYLCVCFSDVAVIRIMGGKPHSWGQDLRGFVCLLQQME